MSDREEYEKNLKRRQAEHLRRVRDNRGGRPWRPCLHDGCPSCHGTGVKLDGTICVHFISCRCPKCSPSFMGAGNRDFWGGYRTRWLLRQEETQ